MTEDNQTDKKRSERERRKESKQPKKHTTYSTTVLPYIVLYMVYNKRDTTRPKRYTGIPYSEEERERKRVELSSNSVQSFRGQSPEFRVQSSESRVQNQEHLMLNAGCILERRVKRRPIDQHKNVSS